MMMAENTDRYKKVIIKLDGELSNSRIQKEKDDQKLLIVKKHLEKE